MPISKLPVESLVRIFCVLRDMDVRSRSHRWLLVTHVCRDWRLVALDAAQLWTHIYSLNEDCVQTFLARSKKAPLDICYPQQKGKNNRLDAVTTMLLSESSRFHRVEFSHSGTAHAFLVHHFPDGAPLLSDLTLKFFSILIFGVHASTTTAVLTDIVPRICDHGVPALRRLHLERWPVASLASLSSLINPSLRALVIKQPHTRYPTTTWAHVLMGLPLLEELNVTCVFPQLALGAALPVNELMPLVRLPHLSSLELLGDNTFDQLSLLKHIAASSDVHITVATMAQARREIPFECYTDVLRTLNQKFAPKQPKTFSCPTSLALQLPTTGAMAAFAHHSLCATLSVIPDSHSNTYCARVPPYETTPSFMLSCAGLDLDHHDFSTPLCDMLGATFAWSKLRKLSLAPSHRYIPSADVQGFLAFRNLFLQMTNLRVLSIGSYYLGPSDCLLTLLGDLDGPMAEHGNSGAARVLIPVLEILTVQGLTGFEPLHRALASRKAAGYPLPRVHICCDLSYRQVEPGYLVEALQPAAAPLAALGCCVDFCEGNGGDLCIKEFAPA